MPEVCTTTAFSEIDVGELAQAGTTITFRGDATLASGARVHVEGALRDYWPSGHFAADSRLAVTVTGVHHTLATEPPIVLDVPPISLLHDLHTGEGALAGAAHRRALPASANNAADSDIR